MRYVETDDPPYAYGPDRPGATTEQLCEANGHVKYGGPPGTEPTCYCGFITYHDDGSRSWPPRDVTE